MNLSENVCFASWADDTNIICLWSAYDAMGTIISVKCPETLDADQSLSSFTEPLPPKSHDCRQGYRDGDVLAQEIGR